MFEFIKMSLNILFLFFMNITVNWTLSLLLHEQNKTMFFFVEKLLDRVWCRMKNSWGRNAEWDPTHY